MNCCLYSEAICELKGAGIAFSENVALCNYTTFKIGGETPLMVSPASLEEVSQTVKLFNKYNIEDERTNKKTTMLLCGIGTDKKKLENLKKALKNFSF